MLSKLNYTQVIAVRQLMRTLRQLRVAGLLDINVISDKESGTYSLEAGVYHPGLFKSAEDLMWDAFAEMDALGFAFDTIDPDTQE